MARFETGETVRCKGKEGLFVFWNVGVSGGINKAVVERYDDREHRNLPRFQAVRLDAVSKVTEVEKREAATTRKRTAMG